MLDIQVKGFKDIQAVLTDLASPDTVDEISDTAARLFKKDILRWINRGRSFTSRSGNLLASIKADTDMAKGIAEIMTGNNKAFYAIYVEKSIPFFYADLDNRFNRILDMAKTILARKINGTGKN
jgi:hypothetical protein